MIDQESISGMIENIKAEGRQALTEYESKRILLSYGIPTTREFLVTSSQEAVEAAGEIGLPVVMKVVSPQILHKTEGRCVKINVGGVREVRRSFRELLQNAERYAPHATVHGVLVQEMVGEGIETIIGTTLDETFGPVIMFGLGGIYVEALRDVSFRIIPIRLPDAEEMIHEIRGYELLKGTRGKEPADLQALIDVLMKTSSMVKEMKTVKEVDVNPLFVGSTGVKAADARVLLK